MGLGKFVPVQAKPNQPLGSSPGARALPLNGLYLKTMFCTAKEASPVARDSLPARSTPGPPQERTDTGVPSWPRPPASHQQGRVGPPQTCEEELTDLLLGYHQEQPL